MPFLILKYVFRQFQQQYISPSQHVLEPTFGLAPPPMQLMNHPTPFVNGAEYMPQLPYMGQHINPLSHLGNVGLHTAQPVTDPAMQFFNQQTPFTNRAETMSQLPYMGHRSSPLPQFGNRSVPVTDSTLLVDFKSMSLADMISAITNSTGRYVWSINLKHLSLVLF